MLDPVLLEEREGNDEHSDEKATTPSVPTAPESHPAPIKKSHDVSNDSPRMKGIVNSFLMEEIDPAQASAQLTAYCFMTGFIDAVSFSAIFVWCSFQTGNSLQLAFALARHIDGQHNYTFRIVERQALFSFLTFIFGVLIARIGDKIGCKTCMWMMLGTFIQTLFTMSAAIIIWKSNSISVADSRGDPAWTDALSFVALGFISASMGLQCVMGKRLNTQFATTVVFTTTWCDLLTEPQLFIYRLVASRDHKLMAIVFVFLGCLIGSALSNMIGDAGTLGIGTSLRFMVMLWWLFVPAERLEASGDKGMFV